MKVKYMGTADIRQVLAGEDAGGRLSEPLSTDVVWDASNKWVVDTEDGKYSDVPEEFWTLLIESGDFRDVSDYKRVPVNAHQATFLGMKETTTEDETAAEAEARRQAALEEQARLAEEANQAEAARDATTYAELQKVAKNLQISGRSNMSKEELEEAIEQAQQNA